MEPMTQAQRRLMKTRVMSRPPSTNNMRRCPVRLLCVFVLLVPCAPLNSSCSVLGPIVGLPIQLAGSALQMLTSNPIGTAAAAATLF